MNDQLHDNPYKPETVIVKKVTSETPNIKSFELVFEDSEIMENFTYMPGQVAQLSVYGFGESTFGFASSPTRKDHMLFSIMEIGENTAAIHELYEGDRLGFRGPLGNWFPVEEIRGKDIYIIGGGIGMAPLRSLLVYLLDNKKDYGNIQLLYGCKTPGDMCYLDDRKEWECCNDLDVVLTIDNEYPGWDKRIGFVPSVLKELAPNPKNSVAVTCGPPIMIKYVLDELEKLNFKPDQIITTLEKRMKCGIGKCGRCGIGHKYVCVDGPVFSLAQLKELPNDL